MGTETVYSGRVDGRAQVTGSFWILVLFDVSEQIRLDKLREILGAGSEGQPALKGAADYVRFERPPVIEDAGRVEQFSARLKYFDYGVVSVELTMDFSGSWDDLVALSARWIEAQEAERCATEVLKSHLERVRPALDQPYATWLTEDYRIVHIREAWHPEGRMLTASAMLDTRGDQIAQIVLGETVPVSEMERERVLRSGMSYYASDLVVTGWSAALIYDTASEAAPVVQILEYANSQLLEFRHYDVVFTDVLRRVYRSLEKKSGLWGRWKLAREAQWLNTIRLDVTELTERADYAIKFLGDRFYARLYRTAADRIGVSENRNLVEEKLKTAGELYEFMVNEFHQARAFVLEVLVVAILVIELLNVFRR
jgi:hypothetical protein